MRTATTRPRASSRNMIPVTDTVVWPATPSSTTPIITVPTCPMSRRRSSARSAASPAHTTVTTARPANRSE